MDSEEAAGHARTGRSCLPVSRTVCRFSRVAPRWAVCDGALMTVLSAEARRQDKLRHEPILTPLAGHDHAYTV